MKLLCREEQGLLGHHETLANGDELNDVKLMNHLPEGASADAPTVRSITRPPLSESERASECSPPINPTMLTRSCCVVSGSSYLVRWYS